MLPFRSLSYRPEVDGLRAVAIALVVLFHAFPNFCPAGFIGVDVFFVISGFLITSILLKEVDAGKFTFIGFYARRFRRILPGLLLMLSVTWIAGWWLLLPNDFMSLGHHIWAASFFSSNFYLWREAGYFDKSVELKPFLHLWSIAVEEQFYLFWPCIVALLAFNRKIFKAALIVLVLASLLLNLKWAHSDSAKAFYLFPSRAWELGLGCWLASLESPENLAKPDPAWRNALSQLLAACAASLLVVALVYPKPSTLAYPTWLTLLPVASAGLVIYGGRGTWLGRLLSSHFMVRLGLISYPLYLWHWPLLSFLHIRIASPTLLQRSACVCVAVLLAIGTRKYMEEPVLRARVIAKSGAFNAKRIVAAGIGALLGLSALGYATDRAHLLPHVPQAVLDLASYRNYSWDTYKQGKCFLENPLATFKDYGETCHAALGETSVFIWGDSYSATFHNELAQLTEATGAALSTYSASMCPPLLGIAKSGLDVMRNCVATNDHVFQQILKTKPKVVILFANWVMYAPFLPYFKETLKALQDAGIRSVLVMGQVPFWQANLYEILEKRLLYRHESLPEWSSDGLEQEIFLSEEKVKTELVGTQAQYLPLLASVCKRPDCLVRLGPNISTDLVTMDHGHPTRTAVHFYISKIRPLVERAIRQ